MQPHNLNSFYLLFQLRLNKAFDFKKSNDIEANVFTVEDWPLWLTSANPGRYQYNFPCVDVRRNDAKQINIKIYESFKH